METSETVDTNVAIDLLDPGIADVVIMLRNLGFNPTDSGDGVSKPDEQREFDVKHVACTVDLRDIFFSEAERLKQVLGSGWRVEATYTPASGPDFPRGAYYLLATKNEPPGPRHQSAIDLWNLTVGDLSTELALAFNGAPIRKLETAALALYAALKHELGRR